MPGVILDLPRDPAPGRRVLASDGSEGARAIALPPALRAAERVTVYSDPFDVAFDARSLAVLPRLEEVELRRAVAQLGSLAEADLTALEFRYVPDLGGLPPLSSWPRLDKVIVWNCDAEATKRLRGEIRRMPGGSSESAGFRSASRGRDRAWFATEYGLPFSGWPRRTASAATRAFGAAAKLIARAATRQECLKAIDAFVGAANKLPDIMTAEREDLGEAVAMLADLTELLDGESVLRRFDELRHF